MRRILLITGPCGDAQSWGNITVPQKIAMEDYRPGYQQFLHDMRLDIRSNKITGSVQLLVNTDSAPKA